MPDEMPPPAYFPLSPEQERELRDALTETMGRPWKYKIMEPGHVLADTEIIADTWTRPDGTDEVNWVRIRVTSSHPSEVDAALHAEIAETVRRHFLRTVRADG